MLEPNNPVPFYAVGAVNWILIYDKVAPPPPQQQSGLIEEGLQNLDRALVLEPDYEAAMVYKNLLLREQARLTSDETQKRTLIAQADEWFSRALETRRRYDSAAPTGVGMLHRRHHPHHHRRGLHHPKRRLRPHRLRPLHLRRRKSGRQMECCNA